MACINSFMPPQGKQACKTLVYSQVTTEIWLWALQDHLRTGEWFAWERGCMHWQEWVSHEMRKQWWCMAKCHTEEPWSRCLSSLTPCAQDGNLQQTQVHVFPYSKGRGLKKPSESILMHTERAKQAFLQLSMSWVIFIFSSHFPAGPWERALIKVVIGLSSLSWEEEILLLLRSDHRSISFSLFPHKAEEEMRYFPEGKQERGVSWKAASPAVR